MRFGDVAVDGENPILKTLTNGCPVDSGVDIKEKRWIRCGSDSCCSSIEDCHVGCLGGGSASDTVVASPG